MHAVFLAGSKQTLSFRLIVENWILGTLVVAVQQHMEVFA
jgi:hypothetical protein